MATHSSILAWRIPWTENWQAMVCGVLKSWTNTTEHAHTTFQNCQSHQKQGKTGELSLLGGT